MQMRLNSTHLFWSTVTVPWVKPNLPTPADNIILFLSHFMMATRSKYGCLNDRNTQTLARFGCVVICYSFPSEDWISQPKNRLLFPKLAIGFVQVMGNSRRKPRVKQVEFRPRTPDSLTFSKKVYSGNGNAAITAIVAALTSWKTFPLLQKRALEAFLCSPLALAGVYSITATATRGAVLISTCPTGSKKKSN